MTDLTRTVSQSGVATQVYDNGRHLLYLATTSGDILRWDPIAGSFLSTLHVAGSPSVLTLSADGSSLLVAEGTGYRYVTGAYGEIDRISLSDFSSSVLYLPQNTNYSHVSLVSMGGSAQAMLRYDQSDVFLTPSENQKYTLIAAANQGPGGFTVYDNQANTVKSNGSTPGFNSGQQDITDGTGLIVDLQYNNLYVYDLSANLVKDLTYLSPHNATFPYTTMVGAHFSAGGHQLYLWNQDAGQIQVYDTTSWLQIGAVAAAQPYFPIVAGLAGAGPAGHMQVSADGQFLFLNTGTGFQAIDLAAELSLTITGTGGDDHLYGGAGTDTISGGGGDDVIDGWSGSDTLDGGTGVNTVSFASAGGGVTVSLALQGAAQGAGTGSVTLTNFQNLTGSAYADTLIGDAGANVIDGGGGGNDVLDGAGGVNTVSFASAAHGVTVSLALQGAAQVTGVGTDTLSRFQNLTGSGFADTLTGDAGANAIVGGGGADAINGGGGADTLTGGAGADTFVFTPGQAGASVITDFSAAQGDKIDLTAFSAVHSLGGLAGHIAQSGPDAVITLDTSSVTLSGVTASSLTAARFLFTPAGSTPAPADFNHDGLSDVLLRDSTTGDFGYMAPSAFGGSSWQAVGASNPSYGVFAVADFNGDGASDMLLRNDTTGDVGFMDLTPGGGPVWHDIGGSAVSYTVQGTGDFNGDHVTDMLWRNDTSGDVGYTALTSSGGASWVHLGNSSTAYTVEGTGDFNGDGVSDLLFRNDSTGDVGYTALTPSGGARWVYLGGSATAYAVQGSGDFNGDGVSDLLFRNQTSGDYGYTALTPSGGASWHALGVSDPTYAIVATGDFNGDGMADVLQRNNATGDYGYMATTSAAGVWHDVGVTDAAHFII
jgi:Ca2+-binding RTX toxin-like protein